MPQQRLAGRSSSCGKHLVNVMLNENLFTGSQLAKHRLDSAAGDAARHFATQLRENDTLQVSNAR